MQQGVIAGVLRLVIVATLAAASSGITLAAETTVAGAGVTSSDTLEEVIVSARRQEESLQNVPVSVTAISAVELANRSVQNLVDLNGAAPNVQISPSSITGGAAAAVYVRGIGQYDEAITTDPGVGIYVDGVYLARTTGGLLDLADFERVEVLRGPQGTLFGKNTIGGAINITTHKPEREFGGEVKLTGGSYSRMDAGATLNVPLGDAMAARLSVLSLNRDGFGERSDGEELGDIERRVGRLQLRWLPSDDLDVNFAVDGTRKRENQGVRSLVYVNPNAPLAFLENLFVQPFDARYIPDDPYDSFATTSNTDELDAWGTSLKVDWNVGGLQVQSITAYRTQESTTGQDADQSPANMIQFDEEIESEQISHEDHIGGSMLGERVDWLAGIILFREEADQQTLSLQVPDLAPIIGDLTRLDRYSITNTSYGVFGEATWHVTDRLGLTAGLRYTHEKKEWSYDFRRALSGTPILPPGELEDTWEPVTPRLGIEFRPTDQLLTYASAAKGFRSGGFNARATSATGIQSFDPETVMSYEAGIKSQLLEDRLRINASLFYSDYKDIQLLIASASAGGGFEVSTENAASAEIKGAELELTARPLHGLEVAIGLGYMDSSIEESAPGTGIAVGNELMETPEWSGSASLQYTFPLGALGEMLLRADYSYRSEIWHDAANTPTLLTDGYGLGNARIGFTSPDGAWNLAAFVTNVADEEYRVTGFDASVFGFADGAWGRPREFGASVTYRF